ncbi:MAG: hypothetical protein R2852_09705 [Bacteroidia bacterium]
MLLFHNGEYNQTIQITKNEVGNELIHSFRNKKAQVKRTSCTRGLTQLWGPEVDLDIKGIETPREQLRINSPIPPTPVFTK